MHSPASKQRRKSRQQAKARPASSAKTALPHSLEEPTYKSPSASKPAARARHSPFNCSDHWDFSPLGLPLQEHIRVISDNQARLFYQSPMAQQFLTYKNISPYQLRQTLHSSQNSSKSRPAFALGERAGGATQRRLIDKYNSLAADEHEAGFGLEETPPQKSTFFKPDSLVHAPLQPLAEGAPPKKALRPTKEPGQALNRGASFAGLKRTHSEFAHAMGPAGLASCKENVHPNQ